MSPTQKTQSMASLLPGHSTESVRGRSRSPDLEMAGMTSGGGDAEKLSPIPEPPAAEGPKQSPPTPAAPGAAPPNNIYNPKSVKFWAIMLCNFLALFLVALDRTILATAIPRITDEFRSLGDVGWYGSAYMLTTSASQLLFGRVYKFYPTKWVFLTCIVVFEIGSAICGASPNSIVFIVGRAIAGLASAGIFTGCMMMFMVVPLHKRPMFQGLFGLVFGIASVMGPLIGGAFTGTVSWRWCFWMNLPIGAVSFIFMILWWNPPELDVPPAPFLTHVKRLDPIGTFFFLPAIVALLLALQWGGSTYAWGSGVIIALFVVFGVLTMAFAAVQILRPDTATIPPRVITQRSVFFATLFTFFIAGSMLMCVYFVPIWFQTAKGVSPLESGIYTLPLVLSLVISSMMAGITTSKIGYYVPSMILSPSIMAIGTGLMSTMNTGSSSGHWIGYQFLTGFGLGLGMQTGGLAVQTVLPMQDVSTGISINFFAQQLGGAIFTSVGQAILSNVLVAELAGVDGLQPDAIVNAGITELLHSVPAQDRGLIAAAYNFACTRIFLAAMGLTFGSLIAAFCMEWRNIKTKPGGPGAGGPPPAAAADQSGPVKGDGSAAPQLTVRISNEGTFGHGREKGVGAETPDLEAAERTLVGSSSSEADKSRSSQEKAREAVFATAAAGRADDGAGKATSVSDDVKDQAPPSRGSDVVPRPDELGGAATQPTSGSATVNERTKGTNERRHSVDAKEDSATERSEGPNTQRP